MARFPKLKTGAVTQYPSTMTVEYANQVLRFVDGSEQRYRDRKAPLRSWVIELEMLDEGELAELDVFFLGQNGRYATFSFTDPRDGTEYPRCSLSEDSMEIELSDEMRGGTRLVIREERS